MTDQKFTCIRDVTPAMKSINAQFIVLDVGQARRTKDGNDVRTVRVADHSGSVNIALWNEMGACLKAGDICRLLNGFVTVHKNALCLNCGKMGELQRIGEFCMLFSESPFMSAPNPEYAKYNAGGESGNGSRQSQSVKPNTR